MAIDPGIIGQLNIPQFKPVDPLATMAQLENLKGLQEERQAMAQERLSQAQKMIQAAKDQATLNAAVQAAGGDIPTAIKALRVGGNANVGDTLETLYNTHNQAQLTATKTHLENQGLVNTQATQMLQAATPDNWSIVRGNVLNMIGSIDPDAAKQFEPLLPQQYDKNAVDAALRGGDTHAEYVQRNLEAVKHFQSKDFKDGLANALSVAPDQTIGQGDNAVLGKADIIKAAKQHGASDDDLLWAQNLVNSGAKGQQFLDAALNPEQKSNAANAAQQRKDAEAVAAETHRHNVEQEAIERLKANGQLTPDGAPSEAVKQYADDLVKGNITIMGVPAGGGMRNAVEAYMRAQHFDMTRPLTAQVEARVEFAQAQMPQIDAVEAMAKEIDRQGLMGTFAGRFRDLAAKESTPAAIGGLTADQRKLIGDFMSSSEFLSSGVAMTHFGTRASGDAVNMMREQLDPKGKDLETYLGNLTSARRIMEGYAALKPGGAKPPAGSSSTSSAPVAGVYNPATKKIEPVKKGGG